MFSALPATVLDTVFTVAAVAVLADGAGVEADEPEPPLLEPPQAATSKPRVATRRADRRLNVPTSMCLLRFRPGESLGEYPFGLRGR
jgi:hypothetical protein